MAFELKKIEDAVATSRQTARQLSSPLGAVSRPLEQAEYLLGELRAVVRGRAEGHDVAARLDALINGCVA